MWNALKSKIRIGMNNLESNVQELITLSKKLREANSDLRKKNQKLKNNLKLKEKIN